VRNRRLIENSALSAAVLAVALLALLYIYPLGQLAGIPDWLTGSLSPVLIGSVLHLTLSGNVLSGLLFENGFMRYTGTISYSMYLYHLPLLLLVNKYFTVTAAALPVYLLVLYLVSHLSFDRIEKPFILSRGKQSRKSVPL
jgi:peptidoglycan/LPS O-acetylase OafA/YrhL